MVERIFELLCDIPPLLCSREPAFDLVPFVHTESSDSLMCVDEDDAIEEMCEERSTHAFYNVEVTVVSGGIDVESSRFSSPVFLIVDTIEMDGLTAAQALEGVGCEREIPPLALIFPQATLVAIDVRCTQPCRPFGGGKSKEGIEGDEMGVDARRMDEVFVEECARERRFPRSCTANNPKDIGAIASREAFANAFEREGSEEVPVCERLECWRDLRGSLDNHGSHAAHHGGVGIVIFFVPHGHTLLRGNGDRSRDGPEEGGVWFVESEGIRREEAKAGTEGIGNM